MIFNSWEIIPILVLAVVLDLALGEPPDAIHPVAWMGKVISFLERGGLRLNSTGQFIYGIIMTALTVGLFSLPLYYILFYLGQVSLVAEIILAGIVLKITFSIKGMRQAALKIKKLLEEKKLDETRFELRALVSRDTKDLPESMLASSAVESVAEGTGDSVVAPLFYFMLFGVPGAIGYRVINTLDSMIGYHGKYEYLGKFSSRLDDVLNYIPARLATMLLVLATSLKKKTGRRAWQTALQEHTVTESPNAGWPMAAMSGALNVRLEKSANYTMGKHNAVPGPGTIYDSVQLFLIAALAWIAICLVAGGIQIAITT